MIEINAGVLLSTLLTAVLIFKSVIFITLCTVQLNEPGWFKQN